MENLDPNFIDNAWQNMHQILDAEMPEKKRKKGIFFWIFSAAALVVGASLCAYLSFDLWPKTSKNEVVKTDKETENATCIQPAKKELFLSKFDINNTFESCRKSIAEHEKQPEKTTTQIVKCIKPSETDVKIRNTQNTVNKVFIKEINKIETEKSITDNSKNNLEIAAISDVLLPNTSIENNTSIGKGVENEFELYPLQSAIKNIEKGAFPTFVLDYKNIETKQHTKPKTPRFGWNVYVHNLTTKRISDGYRIGTNLTYRLSPKWKIGTGLQFQLSNTYYKYSNDCTICDNFVLDQSGSKFMYENQSNYSFSNSVSVFKKVNRLSIPFMLSYQITKKFSLETGIYYTMTQNHFTTYAEKDNSIINFTGTNVVKRNIIVGNSNIDLSLSTNYAMNKRFSADLGFQLHNPVSLSKISPNSQYYIREQSNISLFMGLRYKIK